MIPHSRFGTIWRITNNSRFLVIALALLVSAHASAAEFTTVEVDTSKEQLALFLADENGVPFGEFQKLEGHLSRRGQTLKFAMNAGMYHADRMPVGLLVINGQQLAPLNTGRGQGNFYLAPNGVFALTSRGPIVIETSEYPKIAGSVLLATQSGPMLLTKGVVNAQFSATSASRLIRNGVCARGPKAYFVISETPVNFYEFASYFKNQLGCRDALYFDGVVSSLHSTAHGRSDRRAQLGPIIAVVERRP